MVRVGLSDPGHQRMTAVCANHDPGMLTYGGAAPCMSSDPRDASVFDDHVFNGERFPNLRAGLGGGVNEQLVENRSSRTVSDR